MRFPLSTAQRLQWDRYHGGAPRNAYNLSVPFEIEGDVEMDALERAVLGLLRRHEVLRARFEDDLGEPTQIVETMPASVLQVVEGPDAPRAFAQAREEPFDLRRGGLVRAVAEPLPDGCRLLLVLHHIVADGRSLITVVEDVVALYASEARAGSGAPRPLRAQFLPWARQQHNWLDSPQAAARLEGIARRLRGAPALCTLAPDHPRQEVQQFVGRELASELEGTLVEDAARTARTLRATPFMVWCAALIVTLARWTGLEDVVVATPVGSRPAAAFDDVVGCFVTRGLVRCPVPPSTTFADVVQRVRAEVLESIEQRDIPLGRVCERLGVQPSRAWSPLAQVLFAHEAPLHAPITASGLRWTVPPPEVDEAGEGPIRADVVVTVRHAFDGAALIVSWATDLYDRDTMRRFAASYRETARATMADPFGPVRPAAD